MLAPPAFDILKDAHKEKAMRKPKPAKRHIKPKRACPRCSVTRYKRLWADGKAQCPKCGGFSK